MTYSMPKSLPCLLLASCLVFLAGCASGPPNYYYESDTIKASFEALQTTDPEVQAARFGVYAKAAGKAFVGTMPDGALAMRTYQWSVPGVVLEEHGRWPWQTRLALQYNPETHKIDVFNNTHYGTHIRELTVLPDGSVEWPVAFLGLEPVSRLTFDENGKLERVFQGSGERLSLRGVPPDEFEAVLADAVAQRASDEREKTRSSREFWNSVSQGLDAASTQLQAESEAQQLREAERRSAIMRSQDAELRAMDQRLAEQQREAALQARQQSAQKVREARSLGSIIVEDTTERDRKLKAEEAERERRTAAELAARRQRIAQENARSYAAEAPHRAEVERRRAKDKAESLACLASGRGNCVSRQ